MHSPCDNLECQTLLTDAAGVVGSLAFEALVKEVELTPKPGLVDRHHNGAHTDMNLDTFYASARAIAPWFPQFYHLGAALRHLPPEEALAHLRPAGLACEAAMLDATGGVNTHKGIIFSLGLLVSAAGRLGSSDAEKICIEAAHMCQGIVATELAAGLTSRTAGERAFRELGLCGVRGEAASGFATVRRYGLPAFMRLRAAGGSEEASLHEALLHIMAENSDTNLIRRGGSRGLAFVQEGARRLIDAGGVAAPEFYACIRDFDAALIQRNLSPGGSADLLAVTCFLAALPGAARIRPFRGWRRIVAAEKSLVAIGSMRRGGLDDDLGEHGIGFGCSWA
jgi:triphosphoribosyl-dephospho-CoA synthase